MRSLNARPHWGKELDHTAAELRPLYPAFDRFLALRNALDPDRVFGTASSTAASWATEYGRGVAYDGRTWPTGSVH